MDTTRRRERTEIQAHVSFEAWVKSHEWYYVWPRLAAVQPEVLPRLLRQLRRRHRQVALHPQHRPLAAGEPPCAVLTGDAGHLRQRNPEDLFAGAVERNTPLLVFGRAEDLRMRAAELLERPDVGVFGVRVYSETAVERERIGAAERIPKVLEPHGGLGVPHSHSVPASSE